MSRFRIASILYPRSLYHKLSLIFLILVFLLAATQYFLISWLAGNAEDRRDQMFYANLAAQVAQRLESTYEKAPVPESIDKLLAEITTLNPRIDVYVLDSKGLVLHSNHPEWKHEIGEIAKQINISPVEKFLEFEINKELPLYAQNPSEGQKAVTFSAYPIVMGDIRGFVYIVLKSSQFQTATRGIIEYYATYTGILGYGVLTIFVGLMGVLLFLFVTRRFRMITKTVRDISQGNLQSRSKVGGSDELGELGMQIDSMAHRIEETLFTLREVDSKRRGFVAKVSHDLRGPLAAARGFAEVLEGEMSGVNELGCSKAKSILSNLDRLDKMIFDLHELSKLEMHEHTPNFEEFDLVELIEEEIIPRCSFLAKKNGISINIVENESQLFVKADMQMIERVLFNLIDNAIAYNNPGGSVTIELSRRDSFVDISISDSGIGMSKEETLRIFDTFYRAGNSAATGSGLGLAIVKLIVEAHGSEIDVESVRGDGTSFRFYLPSC